MHFSSIPMFSITPFAYRPSAFVLFLPIYSKWPGHPYLFAFLLLVVPGSSYSRSNYLFLFVLLLHPPFLQGGAECSPWFEGWIAIKRFKVHEKCFYIIMYYCFFQNILKITSYKWWPLRAIDILSLSNVFSATLLSISRGIPVMASSIASFRVSRVRGRTLCTSNVTYPHRKSHTGSNRKEIRRLGKSSCKISHERRALWPAAPFYWNQKASLSCSLSHSSILGRKKVLQHLTINKLKSR